jgi:palmitoyltransferase ZDHHC13/17
MAHDSQANGAAAKTAPAQPASKGDAAAPKLNHEMEMGDLPADKPPETDIMQIARVGDIPAMEQLFEQPGYDATYTDDEGITPLHVCLSPD